MTKKPSSKKQGIHGTVGKHPKGTNPLPTISCGKTEIKVLKELLASQKQRFNLRQFAIRASVHRPNVYPTMDSLIRKGLVVKNGMGDFKINQAGINYLEMSGHDRRVCLGDEGGPSIVRDHKFTFCVKIFSRPAEWEHSMVDIINNHFIQTRLQNFSKNNPILYAHFPENVDVKISNGKAIIKPKGIYADDHAEAAAQAINKAYSAIQVLRDAGVGVLDKDNRLHMTQTEGHYAEVNSLLAQFFEKHAPGFMVPGPDGKPLFWIDHSDGHLEHEVADESANDRLTKWMFDVLQKDSPKPSEMAEDLSKIKDIVSDLVKLTVFQLVQQPKQPEKKLEYPNYIS